MKILLTADWHIKLSQKNIPKQWAVDRYYSLIDQVNSIDCDIHVVAGDVFDRLPSLEELQIFCGFVMKAKVPTIIFDGNHCATKKGQTFLGKLQGIASRLNDKVSIVTEVTEYEWGTILPYCKLHKKGVFSEINTNKPLFTHVRGEIPPHVKPEIDLDLLSDFPIVYAGDLHSHSNSQRNIIYPGSPVTTSFHRSLVDTGYILLEGTEWSWYNFDVPQLIRKTVSSEEEMVKTDYHHTIYEVEGDITSLANVNNTELLDKKVVKRNTESTLVFDKSMTVVDELMDYLLYILEIPEDTAKEVIGVFSDYIKET